MCCIIVYSEQPFVNGWNIELKDMSFASPLHLKGEYYKALPTFTALPWFWHSPRFQILNLDPDSLKFVLRLVFDVVFDVDHFKKLTLAQWLGK